MVIDNNKILQFREEIIKQLLRPLRTLSKFTVIAGAFALLFEVKYFSEFAVEVYSARLGASAVAFIVLLLSQFNFGKKHPVLLLHVLLISIVGSSWIVVVQGSLSLL